MARRFKKPKPLRSARPSVSLPAPRPAVAGFTQYAAAQFNRTELFLRNGFFADVIGALDCAYDTVRTSAGGVTPGEARICLASHQAMFSAASSIARGVPLDAAAASRRALEGARIALAIKLDRTNGERWIGFRERMSRWEARKSGEKAPKLSLRYDVLDEDDMAKQLGVLVGILSDAAVHFTPEFFSGLDFHERAGGTKLFSDYLVSDDAETARHLAMLAAVHVAILRTLDRCCDGRLGASFGIEDIVSAAQRLRGKYPYILPQELSRYLEGKPPTTD